MIELWHVTEDNYPEGVRVASFRSYTDVFKYLEADKNTWRKICRDYMDEQWELRTPKGPILLNSKDGRAAYYKERMEE